MSKLKNIVSEADREILRQKYEFVQSSSTQSEKGESKKTSDWQDRMVQRYNDNLYKEFALADISRPGQLGLRWRTQQEVIGGRGETSCGNKRCLNSEDLSTLEVPFAYKETGILKKELVKIRLCPICLPRVASKSTSQRPKRPKTDIDGSTSSAGRIDKRREEETSSSSSSSQETQRDQKRRRRKISS